MIAITKVEVTPRSVHCGDEVTIAAYVYEVSNGAGDRKMPFRLRDDTDYKDE